MAKKSRGGSMTAAKRYAAKKPGGKGRAKSRRAGKAAKKAVSRRTLAPKKAVRRPKRIAKRVPRKVAQKTIAPKARSPTKKSVVVAETPSSIASILAERIAAAG